MSPIEINAAQLDALRVCSTVLIATMSGIKKFYDEEYIARRQAANEVIQAGYDIHVEFYKLMFNVSKQCDSSQKILECIKSELKIAEKTGAFDEDNVIEIKLNSEKLLGTVKFGEEHNMEIFKNIISHRQEIEVESTRIEEASDDINNRNAMRGITNGGAAAGAVVGAAVAAGAVVSTGGALLFVAGGGALIGIITRVISSGKTGKIVKDLKKLNDLMTELQDQSDNFAVSTEKIITEIKEYICSAELNVKYRSSNNASRVKTLAEKMIKETVALQSSFKDIEFEASTNAIGTRKSILKYNPKALLNL